MSGDVYSLEAPKNKKNVIARSGATWTTDRRELINAIEKQSDINNPRSLTLLNPSPRERDLRRKPPLWGRFRGG